MENIQQGNFSIIAIALEDSVQKLKESQKEAAENILRSIKDTVTRMEVISSRKEQEATLAQQHVKNDVSEILIREGEIRNSIAQVNLEINDFQVNIASKEQNKTELSNQINSLSWQLQSVETDLRRHRAKLDELNDTSVGSIFRSFFSLGLDRAAMGIAALIDDDAGRISSLREEIKRLQEERYTHEVQAVITSQILNHLYEKKNSSMRLISEFEVREKQLQMEERQSRRRLVYFTEISLFYGKLSLLLKQVDHRVEDVADIVGELNSTTPTIISFDPSNETLLTLRASLEQFDAFLQHGAALITS
ncbi:chromosome segregation protein [Chromobacterium violaceum]|uniref:Chromosome segregation protein n=1 Tax=Chromobacterium violaceum TaxID=536 RepID=A0A3S4HG33_CHRVL|nr:chromosome segregation protein [Chromobacterium violaceum]